jgi:hypothetical protein
MLSTSGCVAGDSSTVLQFTKGKNYPRVGRLLLYRYGGTDPQKVTTYSSSLVKYNSTGFHFEL